MREQLIGVIEKNTSIGQGTTIAQLSSALEKGKNIIAREANKLVEMGTLFRVDEHDIIYFHKQMYEQLNQCQITMSVYSSLLELENSTKKDVAKDFDKLIGNNGSLTNCVEQCIAAISYPNNSLPILLYGPTGTGKSFIAQLMYEYAINHNIIEKDKPFVTLNCSEYANNPELLTANLFGHKKGAYTGANQDNVGLMEVADGGVLFLDEVHCLRAECQEKLFLFMDKGIYHKVGENEKWSHSKVRLIFATTEKPEETLLRTFLRRVPIIVTIPSLKDRGIYERIELIYYSFIQESEKIHKKIKISNFVYNMFVNFDFDGNIGELKNTIKVCCANALIDSEGENVEIHMNHLPPVMFGKKIDHKKQISTDEKMISISELRNVNKQGSKAIELYEKILAMEEDNKERLFSSCFNAIKDYFDYIMYDKRNVLDSKSNYIIENIREIIKTEFKRYDLQINNNNLLLIYKYLESLMRDPFRLRKWQEQNQKEALILKNKFELIIRREILIAEEMVDKINNSLDLFLGDMFICVWALLLKYMNEAQPSNHRLGIIIAHGYSTASSIANAANKLLDDYIFEAIDMPIEVTTQQILDTLNTYLAKMTNYEELVLLVDMGSLEEIYKGIQVDINANIGIINNITTKLALEVGNELRNNTSLHDLLKNACENNSFRYKVIEKKEKEEVVICACASGLGTAEKIRHLLLSSLPATISLNIMPYDYNQLIDTENRKKLFEKYDVLSIIGTINPDIEGILFLPIDELIVDQDIEKIEKVFSSYLSIEEISVFKQNLLKNFSLTNVMENLTILNPTKLLEHVAKALDDFQQLYHIQIRNNTCVGLYVHTCCMIERLVTNRSFDNYPNIDAFMKEHQEFITCIKQAFLNVEKYYGVIIPEDEMGYIYDYISNN